ncbi:MAG: DUF5710 domain-containing protein [Acidimicrobiales bacterium]
MGENDKTESGGTPPGDPPQVFLIDVPIKEKDEAKAAGARWRPDLKSWTVGHPDHPARSRWPEPLPDLLPGEDRSFAGNELFVDLVPSTCWFTNARSAISPSDWARVRKHVCRRAGFACEICSAKGDLHVHERWQFDRANLVQRLRRLICICPPCHNATHFMGTKDRDGDEAAEEALAHLASVRRCSHSDAEQHVLDAFDLWEERSRFAWSLDLSVLMNAGISLVTPDVDPSVRVETAQVVLDQVVRVDNAGATIDKASFARETVKNLQRRPMVPMGRPGTPKQSPKSEPLSRVAQHDLNLQRGKAEAERIRLRQLPPPRPPEPPPDPVALIRRIRSDIEQAKANLPSLVIKLTNEMRDVRSAAVALKSIAANQPQAKDRAEIAFNNIMWFEEIHGEEWTPKADWDDDILEIEAESLAFELHAKYVNKLERQIAAVESSMRRSAPPAATP